MCERTEQWNDGSMDQSNSFAEREPMFHWIIAWFLEQWINGSMDLCQFFWTGEWGRDLRSIAKDLWSIKDMLWHGDGEAVREQRIIGSQCVFFLWKIWPGSLDHWNIGANWNYLHITSLYWDARAAKNGLSMIIDCPCIWIESGS